MGLGSVMRFFRGSDRLTVVGMLLVREIRFAWWKLYRANVLGLMFF